MSLVFLLFFFFILCFFSFLIFDSSPLIYSAFPSKFATFRVMRRDFYFVFWLCLFFSCSNLFVFSFSRWSGYFLVILLSGWVTTFVISLGMSSYFSSLFFSCLSLLFSPPKHRHLQWFSIVFGRFFYRLETRGAENFNFLLNSVRKSCHVVMNWSRCQIDVCYVSSIILNIKVKKIIGDSCCSDTKLFYSHPLFQNSKCQDKGERETLQGFINVSPL